MYNSSFQYNAVFETIVSVDNSGMLEYWTGPKGDYKFPKNVEWVYKTDTDLYEFVKVCHVLSSPNNLCHDLLLYDVISWLCIIDEY